MRRGSYTVEAALLMGILIPLLVGLICLGFYLRAGGEAYGSALEACFRTALLDEAAEGTDLGESWIDGEAERAVPRFPFAGSFFSLPERVRRSCSLDRQKPARQVFRLHSLKKLARKVQNE